MDVRVFVYVVQLGFEGLFRGIVDFEFDVVVGVVVDDVGCSG